MHLEELLTQLNANLARNNELLELALTVKAAPAAPVLIPAEKETPAPAKAKAPKTAAKEAPAPLTVVEPEPEPETPAPEVSPEPVAEETPVEEKTEAPAPDEKISEAQQVAIRAIVREHQQKVGPAAFNAGFQSLLKEHDIQKIAQLNVGEHDAFVAKLLAIA